MSTDLSWMTLKRIAVLFSLIALAVTNTIVETSLLRFHFPTAVAAPAGYSVLWHPS